MTLDAGAAATTAALAASRKADAVCVELDMGQGLTMEPRKLAEGYIRRHLKAFADPSYAPNPLPLDVILSTNNPNWWPENTAPGKCFAPEPPKPSPEGLAREERVQHAKDVIAKIEGAERQDGTLPWVRIVDRPTCLSDGEPHVESSIAGQVGWILTSFSYLACTVRIASCQFPHSIQAHNLIPLSAEEAADALFEQLSHRAESPV